MEFDETNENLDIDRMLKDPLDCYARGVYDNPIDPPKTELELFVNEEYIGKVIYVDFFKKVRI